MNCLTHLKMKTGYLKTLLLIVFTLLMTGKVQAQIWSTTPGSGVWNTATNWNTLSVPSSQGATAIFGASSGLLLTTSANVTVGTLLFNVGAPGYSFTTGTNSMSFFGSGIVNNSASVENFVVSASGGTLNLYNTSSLANSAVTIGNGGNLSLNDTSTLGSAAITNSGGINFGSSTADSTSAGHAYIDNLNAGNIRFAGSSTAASATIINNYILNFSGTSTAGSATIFNAAAQTIAFNNGSTAGSATIVNNGLLNFFSDSSTVYSSAGSANITNANGAAMSFTGFSTAGSANINNAIGASVSFTANSTAGSATIFNNNILAFTTNASAGSATIFNDVNTNFYNSSTMGNATLNNNGTGILVFNNSSSAGGTIINNGSVTFNSDSSSVFSTAGAASITNNGAINFNGFSSAGSATITNNRFGTIFFNGTSTAGNAVINASSLVNFGSGTTAGNASITTTGAGIGFQSASAGSATLTALTANLSSVGVISFGLNSTGGTSRIILGTNAAMDASGETASTPLTVGSVEGSGNVTMGGTNLFVGSNNLNTTLSGSVLSTTGALTKIGTGTWTLTGANTYAGGTSITAGVLNINSDGANSIYNLGSAGTTLTFNGGTLQAGGSFSSARLIGINSGITGLMDTNGYAVTLSGAIKGTGALAVNSSAVGGTLTLTGTNTYTGGTTVNGGSLLVGSAGALGTSLVTVNGGTLGTNGVLHTITSAGNYTQGSKGTLQLGLGANTAGQWDALSVTGTATLGGTLQLIPYSGFKSTSGQTFQIISSTGALTGQFASLSDLLSEPVSLSYVGNTVTVNVLSFAQLGVTGNEKAIAAALDNVAAGSTNTTLVNSLASLSGSALNTAYDQMSPSNITPMFKMGFATAQVQSGMVGDRLSQMFGTSKFNSNSSAWSGNGPMFAGNMPAEEEAEIAQTVSQPERWGAFANGMTNFGTVSSDGNGAGYQFSTGGTTAGVDYRFAKDLVIGLMLGFDQTGTSQSSGTVNARGGQAGLYAGWKADDWHATAFVDGGLDTYTTQRTGFGGTSSGSTSGTEYTGQLSFGFDMKMEDFKVSPFVSGQYTQVNVNGFTETGSLAPLTFGNQGENYINSDLGAGLSRTWNVFGVKLSPSVSAAWEHVYQGNNDSLTANFGSGSSFTVAGSAVGADAAVLGAGLNAEFDKGLNIYANYQGKVGMTNYTDQSLSGGVNFGF